jgi:predicted TPR repeat methyltransferase
LLLSLGIALRDSSRRSRAELDAAFAGASDPWKYSRAEERARHATELGMLDAADAGRLPRVLELGCAEGLFTERLALRCDELVAVDISAISLERARSRCAAHSHVRFEQWDLREWPRETAGAFDLVVAIHVLEYIRSPFALARVRRSMVGSLKAGGLLLVANVYQGSLNETSWWGKFILQGGNWINDFIADHPGLEVISSTQTELGECRSLDVLLRRCA